MQTLQKQIHSKNSLKKLCIHDSPEMELAICCARTHVDSNNAIRIRQLAQHPIDWRRVITFARLHAVLSLLYKSLNALCSTEVPADLLAQLQVQFYSCLFQNLRMSGDLVNLLKMLREHGVDAIPIKGHALTVSVYGSLSLRTFSDLDILVDSADYLRAREILLSQGYYWLKSFWLFISKAEEDAQLRFSGECTLISDDDQVHVYLHSRSLADFMFALSANFNRFRSRLQPISLANQTVYSPKPEDLLIYLCMHGTKDLWVRLSWVCDIAELLRSHPDLDWMALCREAKTLNVQRMLLLGLSLAHQILRTNLPDIIQQKIHADPTSQQLVNQICRGIYQQQNMPTPGLTWERVVFHLRAMEHPRDQLEARQIQPRQRAVGGGRKPRLLGIQEKLFFILFYFKCYPTFDLAGIIFDLHCSQTHEWMHRLQPILEETLGKKMVLPERKLDSIEAFLERFPEVKRVMIDGTERPVQRPHDTEAQTANYSGKKKRHTRNHLAAVDESKRVLVLSKAREGKLHDKRFRDENDIAGSIPDEIPIEADLGFLGLQKEYVNIRLPHCNPKGGELSPQQKEENRALSQSRVICENAFAGVKRYNAVSAIYRNRKAGFDDHL